MSQLSDDPESIKETAKQIVSGQEFAEDKGLAGQISYYLSHPDEAISNALNWIVLHLPWNSTGVSVLAWVVVTVVVLVAVLLIIKFARSVSRDPEVVRYVVPVSLEKSSRELHAYADELEAAKKWQEAVRARYGAMIIELSEIGVLTPHVGKTTGEYVREMRASGHPSFESFARASSIFEWIWYGDTPASETDVQVLSQIRREISQVGVRR